MTQRLRIGEILMARESVAPKVLMQAIREQPTSQRLVSWLISRNELESDEGALALSEQTGFPAALLRHLELRHDSAVDLIPAALALRWVIVPIGVAYDGELVIGARDPTPILVASLKQALQTEIKLAVVPAIHIERLVRKLYELEEDTPLPGAPPSLADAGDTNVSSHRKKRARTVTKVIDVNDESGAIRKPLSSLEATLQEIDAAFSVWAVERLLLAYAKDRWRAVLLVKIVDGVALGHLGHGERLGSVASIMLPVSAPSLIQAAHDTRRTMVEKPAGPVQERLGALLGDASSPVAAPVMVRNEVNAVLVVGDPFSGNYRETVADLEKLVDALGAAYDRFTRGVP